MLWINASLGERAYEGFHDLVPVSQHCSRNHRDAQLMRFRLGDDDLVPDRLSPFAWELPSTCFHHTRGSLEDGYLITLLYQHLATNSQGLKRIIVVAEQMKFWARAG